MPEAWLEDFAPFSPPHAAAVAVCAGMMVAACRLGRRFGRGSARERRLRIAWGVAIVAMALARAGWYFLPSRFDITSSLPLHICDLGLAVAALAMLTGWRPWQTLLYFWGIGLSTQAFITPTLNFGVGFAEFYLFWIGHTMVVGSAVYDLVVGGYRPRAADLALAMAATLVYVALMLPLNLWLDANYGFVGPGTPSNPTLVDAFGPWPWRVGVIVALGALGFVMLWAVWPLSRRVLGGRGPARGSGGT
ncbi:MAG: TIGR02206 family membrane protein [Phycisphaerales bacterium]